MLKSFSSSNWEWLHYHDGTDIDSLWSWWKKQCFEEVDHFIPTRLTVPLSQKSKPWFTSYLQYLIRVKNRLYRGAMRTQSVENWATCRLARNKCNNAVKLAKRTYIQQQANIPANGPSPTSTWWKIAWQLCGFDKWSR